MPTEVRRARADEMDEFARVRSYAFADFAGESPDPPDALTLCAFCDGRLSATSAAWPFTIRWNGAPLRAAGVTMVSVRPELQGRGLLRAIMQRALPSYREQGQAIAVLWASYGAIYQRFGFGAASHTQFYSIDPRHTRLRDPLRTQGQIEVLPATEARDLLKQVYIAYVAPRTLALHRAAPMWEFGILRQRAHEGVFAAVYRAEDGSPRGYAVYETSAPSVVTTSRSPEGLSPTQEMVVRDVAALDAEAYRALWQFLHGHDLVSRISLGPLAADDPAPLLLSEPSRLTRRINTGIWLRVIDVEHALRGRGYGTVGEITLEVRGDSLCDWNNGRYRVRATGSGSAEVERAPSTPDVILSPEALSSLVSGYASASQLHRAGMLDAKDRDVLRTADHLFQTEFAPHCPDAF